MLELGLAERPFGRFEPAGGPTVRILGLGHRRLQPVTSLLGLGQALPELVVLPFEQRSSAPGGRQPYGELVQRTPVPIEGVVERPELSPGHGDRLVCTPQLRFVPPCPEMGLELCRHLLLGPDQSLSLRSECRDFELGGLELLREPSTLGLEGRDHVGIGSRIERLGEGSLALSEDAAQAAGPLDHSFGPTEGGCQVRLALG